VKPLKAWDSVSGHVIYCQAFNKSLAPGLRQGWMNGGQWHGRIQMLKFAQSRNTQTLGQLVVAEVLGSPPISAAWKSSGSSSSGSARPWPDWWHVISRWARA
jgi:DNA-binding transcriptional MocR family regulator